MSKYEGVRICKRCGVERHHGLGQTYCRECHRELARLASRSGICKCGSECAPNQSKCRECRNQALRAKRAGLKVIKAAFAKREFNEEPW